MKTTKWVCGPRNAWDYMPIGPFDTEEEARKEWEDTYYRNVFCPILPVGESKKHVYQITE